jgi:hypothetical protein
MRHSLYLWLLAGGAAGGGGRGRLPAGQALQAVSQTTSIV